MPRRQLPRHKKHARAQKQEKRPAAAQAPKGELPTQPVAPANHDALRAQVRLLATQVREDEQCELKRLLAGWSGLQLLTGEMFKDSLLRMLRARVFSGGVRRCERSDIVQIRQRELGDPLDPVAKPRSHLMCPLHEGKQDWLSPCPRHHNLALMRAFRLFWSGPEDKTPVEERFRLRFELLDDNTREPCTIITQDWSLQQILFGPHGFWEKAAQDPDELIERRKQLLAMDQARLSGDDLRAQLRFLYDSGRLAKKEVELLLDHGLYATDRGWLSCRDDEERTLFLGDVEEDEECSHKIRCPLQHRALLGDRTVPCAQVLEHKPDGALVEAAKAAPPPPCRPEGEPPGSQRAPAGEPGGDLVWRLRILPCHVVGRLLALELPAAMERLCKEFSPERKETSANAAVEADWMG